MMLIGCEVLVFQSRGMSGAILYQATEKTSFKVVNAVNVILVIEAKSVAHQNEMHFFIVLHFDGVYSVNARDERISIILEMLMELRQDFLEQIELFSRHSLHNKTSIVTKEEETATCTCCLASLEDLISVRQWIQ